MCVCVCVCVCVGAPASARVGVTSADADICVLMHIDGLCVEIRKVVFGSRASPDDLIQS